MHIIKNTLAQGAFWQVNKHIAKCLNSLNAAVLLHELIDKFQYHETRDELVKCHKNGYLCFYHTAETITENTTLSYREQKTAVQILKNFGLIDTILMGVPAKLHFTICQDKILLLCNTSIAESAKLDLTKAQNSYNNKDNNKDDNDNNIEKLSSSSETEMKTETEIKNKTPAYSEIVASFNNTDVAPPAPLNRFSLQNIAALKKGEEENAAFHEAEKERARHASTKQPIELLYTPETFTTDISNGDMNNNLAVIVTTYDICGTKLFYAVRDGAKAAQPQAVFANKMQALHYAAAYLRKPEERTKYKKDTPQTANAQTGRKFK